MRYRQGQNREQIKFFPASLDEYASEDNPVRAIDDYLSTL
jgi:hypothetical protein